RPLEWDRLYRGWHGRFDAAALFDPFTPQLIVSGGRDWGVTLATPDLVSTSLPTDVLSDYRALALDTTPPRWDVNAVVHDTGKAKYGHVMGWVTVPGSMHHMGFVVGGSQGSVMSPETLLIDPVTRISETATPFQVQGAGFFLAGMASAIEPDLSSTY